MSRDLHDGLGACLTEISLLSCQGEAAGSPAAAGSTFQALARRSGEALEALRELIWANNPKADNLGSLLARAGDQVGQVLAAARIRARFDLPADPSRIAVGPVFRRQVLLALREAVNNAVRHAQAQQVTLRAVPGPRQLVIEVADDGVGFQAGAVTHATRAEPGVGLHSMRERIESLGGEFELHSAPGAGTCVIFRLPLPHA
jgi:signal transduction histidine kinase